MPAHFVRRHWHSKHFHPKHWIGTIVAPGGGGPSSLLIGRRRPREIHGRADLVAWPGRLTGKGRVGAPPKIERPREVVLLHDSYEWELAAPVTWTVPHEEILRIAVLRDIAPSEALRRIAATLVSRLLEHAEDEALLWFLQQDHDAMARAGLIVEPRPVEARADVVELLRHLDWPTLRLGDDCMAGPGEAAWRALLETASLDQLDRLGAMLLAAAEPHTPSPRPREESPS